MRDAENIRQIDELGCVDWMGFIFWPHSSRYVDERPSYLPEHAKRVGVFVNEDPGRILQIAADYQLDFIQLHGHESPEYVRSLMKQLSMRSLSHSGEPVGAIKAFNIATADDLKQTEVYEGIVDYFLFDTKGKMVGGNGEKFDWDVLQAYKGNTPFILSGGIGPDDAERLKTVNCQLSAVNCIGIDLNSRFEIAPALKDVNRILEFVKIFKS